MKSEDIAKLAGVSRGTVSRVLNGKSDVAEATRKKIEKIIEEHGYTPNVSARKLAGKPVEVIGFFVSNILNNKNREDDSVKWWSHESPYFLRIMVALLGAAKKMGYNTLVDVINVEDEMKSLETYFKSGLISGAVFMGFEEKDKNIDKLIEKGYKIALIDQKENSSYPNCIIANADDYGGAILATEYLIKKGHKDIAHVHGNKKISSGKLRIKGYKDALKNSGITVKTSYIADGNYTEKDSYLATKKILEENKDSLPTAIFFGNDIMAIGGIKALKEKKLDIKKDISIVGFDNYPISESFDTRISSIKAPLEEMAEFAVENLIRNINNEDYVNHFIGKVELVEKNSVRPLINR